MLKDSRGFFFFFFINIILLGLTCALNMFKLCRHLKKGRRNATCRDPVKCGFDYGKSFMLNYLLGRSHHFSFSVFIFIDYGSK